MQILAADIGTGTQDIYLYDSRLHPENGIKLIVPSPTMIVHKKIKQATRKGLPILLTGATMGGGPNQWAADRHMRAGYTIFATPEAARSFNDDLQIIASTGIEIISADEAGRLPDDICRIDMKDFDFRLIAETFDTYGISLDRLAAVAVAVFDHGNAPPDYSDRQFRFDYLNERIKTSNQLSSFAYLSHEIPPIMTRMQSVARTTRAIDAPVVIMDTAPAAVLGATFDPRVQHRQQLLITNIGNLHTLAFRLGPGGIEGLFEHHTGFLDQAKLNRLLISLAEGTIRHEDVFLDHGHGALVSTQTKLDFPQDDFGVIVTGPRRNMLAGSELIPHFAAPFGDMMITGCVGLLAAAADLLPEVRDTIQSSLAGTSPEARPPWEWD